MRVICVFLAVLMLGGCAAHFNKPVQPKGQYWPINKDVPTTEEKASE